MIVVDIINFTLIPNNLVLHIDIKYHKIFFYRQNAENFGKLCNLLILLCHVLCQSLKLLEAKKFSDVLNKINAKCDSVKYNPNHGGTL